MAAVVFLTNQSINLEHVTGTVWLAEDTSQLVPQNATTPGVGVFVPKKEPKFLQVQTSDHFPRTLFLQEDIDEFMLAWRYFTAPRMLPIS